jgi:hypothetical protein
VNLVQRRSVKWGLAILGGTTLVAWPIATAARRGRARPRRGPRAVQRRRPPAARVLFVGDSSPFDVGVTAPRESVAAHLAAAHPSWTIGNLAGYRNRTADVAQTLSRMVRRIGRDGRGPRYDAVVIQIGSVDTLRFAREGPLAVSLAVALAAANELARHAVVVTAGALASAPVDLPPWSWLIGWRRRRVLALFEAIAWEAGVEYIDLCRPADDRIADADLVLQMNRTQ